MNSEQVAELAAGYAAKWGLTVTSHTRTPQENEEVGGAPNSDHLTGLAIDLAGDPDKMAALARWAQANEGPDQLFRWVGWGDEDHLDHVHLSFNANATNATTEEPMVAAAADEITPDSTPEEIEAYIARHYPDVAAFMKGNEAIKWILYDAAINDRDDKYVEGALRRTEYWQTHGPESRAFDLQLAEDPKAASERINNTKILVNQAYQRQGVKKTDAELGEIAKGYIRGGWTPDDLERHVANELLRKVSKGGSTTGDSAADADTLTALAAQYLVPISRKDAETWALNIAANRATQDSFTAWVTSLARARYAAQPDILAAIDQGTTPSQYFASHKATVAQILELDDAQINLLDPKWSWMVETVDEKGNRRAPTLGEVAQQARQRPEFGNTRTYKEQEAAFALGASRFLGEAA